VHAVLRATRSTSTGNFTAPELVTELNETSVNVRPGWLSKDGCRLYLAKGPTSAPFTIVVAEKPAKWRSLVARDRDPAGTERLDDLLAHRFFGEREVRRRLVPRRNRARWGRLQRGATRE
jgi:hypothetical protein